VVASLGVMRVRMGNLCSVFYGKMFMVKSPDTSIRNSASLM
jgi:hypothetical protein